MTDPLCEPGRQKNESAKVTRAASKKRQPTRIHKSAPSAAKIRESSITLWQTLKNTSTNTKSLLGRVPSLANDRITPEPKTIPPKNPANSGKAAWLERLSLRMAVTTRYRGRPLVYCLSRLRKFNPKSSEIFCPLKIAWLTVG